MIDNTRFLAFATHYAIGLHAEELPYLIPLPEKPYDTAEVVYRMVSAEGMVREPKRRRKSTE